MVLWSSHLTTVRFLLLVATLDTLAAVPWGRRPPSCTQYHLLAGRGLVGLAPVQVHQDWMSHKPYRLAAVTAAAAHSAADATDHPVAAAAARAGAVRSMLGLAVPTLGLVIHHLSCGL